MGEQNRSLVDSFKKLYQGVDHQGSDCMTLEEFLVLAADEKTIAWAQSLDLDLRDAASFFEVLSENGAGTVDPETFVEGCIKLKGNARSLDLISLAHQHDRLMTLCEQQFRAIRDLLDDRGRAFHNPLPFAGGPT